MKTIRAKMQVQEIAVTTYSETPKLTPVFGGGTNAEDNTYSKATPSGKLELQIDNPAAKGFFVPGKKYYVDITEAAE